MRRVASRQNPIVSRYRLAARGEARDIMLLDGVHLVDDAIAAGARVREAAVAAASIDDPVVRGLVNRLISAGADVVSVTAPVMAALSGVRSSSAIVALADRPRLDESSVLARVVPDELRAGVGDAATVGGLAAPGNPAATAARAPLIIVAVNVQDPGNVGAIIRVAEAGGATGVMISGASADPFAWKALRGSMGSALRIPVIRRASVPIQGRRAEAAAGRSDAAPRADVDELRRLGFRIVATAPRGGRLLFDADLRGPTAILIGGEGSGLPPELLAAADVRVSIPMEPPVESLNAATTAAVVVYEARRQRSLDERLIAHG
jgi:TrmH family RNA methyltransferase